MKKIFISADIEGVSGITSWEATRYGGKGYEEACRQMAKETADFRLDVHTFIYAWRHR